MMRLISSFVTVLLLPVALGAKYDGMFKLSEAEDEKRAAVKIPASQKSFAMVVRSESADSYKLSLRLGNTLHADMKIAESEDAHDGVQVGPIMSTMMMPPTAIFELEQFMSKELPKMTQIFLADEDNKLILEGNSRIVFERDLSVE